MLQTVAWETFMGLRTLLLPVTGHHDDEVALEVALGLAKFLCAHLAAVCLRPDPVDIVGYVADWSSPLLAGNTLAMVEDQAQADSRDAGRAFEAWRTRHNLPLESERREPVDVSVSWEERIGAPGAILRDMARFADLIVMRGLGAEGPVDGDAMIDAVLFDAGRPVLLTSHVAPADPFGTAMIAWAGGREESRAVSAALPILAGMARVEIRTVGEHDDVAVDRLVRYLARHGIKATAAQLQTGERSVGDTLLAEAKRLEASLLVMGAYHHSRTRELVFGGATRQIVTHVDMPVLLAH
jgi:nucleotide-binding universal stress UspA family protein